MHKPSGARARFCVLHANVEQVCAASEPEKSTEIWRKIRFFCSGIRPRGFFEFRERFWRVFPLFWCLFSLCFEVGRRRSARGARWQTGPTRRGSSKNRRCLLCRGVQLVLCGHFCIAALFNWHLKHEYIIYNE